MVTLCVKPLDKSTDGGKLSALLGLMERQKVPREYASVYTEQIFALLGTGIRE